MEYAKIDIDELLKLFSELNDNQKFWVKRVIDSLRAKSTIEIHNTSVLSDNIYQGFGDALKIHHSFSIEPFSKDKFEYVLEKVCQLNGYDAKLAPKGYRGHDITIENTKYSLKTQADKNIRKNKLWISKFMELGKDDWSDKLSDLINLRNTFLKHLDYYDRILSLRAIQKAPDWKYELVEIPKKLLQKAKNGKLEMKLDSKQFPKPGYCYVTQGDKELYQLYFDAGSERKLQIKNLSKAYCNVWASWGFTILED